MLFDKCNGSKQLGNVGYDLAGNFIQIFYGSRKALKWLLENNITQNSGAHVGITRCCNEIQQEAFGYIWKYMPEPA